MQLLLEPKLPPPAQQPPCEWIAPGGSGCTPKSATNPGQPKKDVAIQRDFVRKSVRNILFQGPSVKQHFKQTWPILKKIPIKYLFFASIFQWILGWKRRKFWDNFVPSCCPSEVNFQVVLVEAAHPGQPRQTGLSAGRCAGSSSSHSGRAHRFSRVHLWF